MAGKELKYIAIDEEGRRLQLSGRWVLPHLSSIEKELNSLPGREGVWIVDGSHIEGMDSAGAWLLQDWLSQQDSSYQLEAFQDHQKELLSLIDTTLKESAAPKAPAALSGFAAFGKSACEQLDEFCAFLAFTGRLSLDWLRLLYAPAKWRWKALASVLQTTGLQALPIIAMLSFMIGVVITYQMGLQLRNYGGNIFIVDLLGMSILREFAPLLTAIMVAGRTGASYTAQLGTMKINQEIDALNTMGVTPGELLLLPRVIGLVIALPLLTMWADIFGVLGGMLMSSNLLGVGWHDFLMRFEHQIPVKALLIGLGKTPAFALIIASIGCFQGMRVGGSADSVGKNTTRSVVLAIFFIIVADAIFSIIFSKLGL